jgi:hypothetical protein
MSQEAVAMFATRGLPLRRWCIRESTPRIWTI